MSQAIDQAFEDLDKQWEKDLQKFTAEAQEDDYIFNQIAEDNISGEPLWY